MAMIDSDDDDGGTGDRKQGSDLPCLKGLDSLPCIRCLHNQSLAVSVMVKMMTNLKFITNTTTAT